MKRTLIYFCLFLIGFVSYSQEKNSLLDDIKTMRPKLLGTMSFEGAEAWLKPYLEIGKVANDSLVLGNVYYILAYKSSEIEARLQYLDSCINYTEKLQNDPEFPMKAYFFKGSSLDINKNYKEALDYYLLAESLANAHKDVSYQYNVKFNMALLKRKLGNYEEAITLFQECLVFEELNKKKHSNQLRYLNILFQLSFIYHETGKYDLCTRMNKKGIRLALKQTGKNTLYHFFVASEGINLNKQKNYQASVDSLQKAIPHVNEYNREVSKFYLGKSLFALGKKQEALHYFKRVDSLFKQTNTLLYPPLRESYEYLIKSAKIEGDMDLQLYYTEQLLQMDSIILRNYKYLDKTITRKYEIPELLADKEALIENLEKAKTKAETQRNWAIELGILFSGLLLVILLYYYRQKRVYEKRYEAIMQQSNSGSIEEEINVQDQQLRIEVADMEADVVEEILRQLQRFEEEELFLKNQISLNEVAKIVNTNSKYLSKVINSYKEKNFATYINDLRIDYIIHQIQHNPIYKKYTVKAIALEGGFSNPQAFYRAFQKRTGLKPTYFIKKAHAGN